MHSSTSQFTLDINIISNVNEMSSLSLLLPNRVRRALNHGRENQNMTRSSLFSKIAEKVAIVAMNHYLWILSMIVMITMNTFVDGGMEEEKEEGATEEGVPHGYVVFESIWYVITFVMLLLLMMVLGVCIYYLWMMDSFLNRALKEYFVQILEIKYDMNLLAFHRKSRDPSKASTSGLGAKRRDERQSPVTHPKLTFKDRKPTEQHEEGRGRRSKSSSPANLHWETQIAEIPYFSDASIAALEDEASIRSDITDETSL